MLSYFSRVLLFATLWTVVHQALLSMEFSRQKYWSGLPYPSPGDPPIPRIEPESPALGSGFFTTKAPRVWKYSRPAEKTEIPPPTHVYL